MLLIFDITKISYYTKNIKSFPTGISNIFCRNRSLANAVVEVIDITHIFHFI